MPVRSSAAEAHTCAAFCDFVRATDDFGAAGIVTVPIKPGQKRPSIRNLRGGPRYGVEAARKIAAKHPDANVGIWCGRVSGITVVDIDSADIEDLAWARDRFGHTPVLVGTPSGGFHLYYRHSGEKRWARRIAGRPIDILGNGICVAPPSVKPGVGQYAFIEGGHTDLRSLPMIRVGALQNLGLALRPAPIANDNIRSVEPTFKNGKLGDGEGRNDYLFGYGCRIGHGALTREALIEVLALENVDKCDPPLDDNELAGIAASVWKYKEAGLLFSLGQQHVVLPRATIDPLFSSGEADALMLLARLAAAHWKPGTRFAASANAMSAGHVLGSWSAARYRAARQRLLDRGVLVEVHHGGRGKGDPSLFRFADGAIHNSGTAAGFGS